MKKLSLILAGALLLGGISFASPVVKKPAQKAPAAQKGTKSTTKSTKATKSTGKKGPVSKTAKPKAATK